VTAGAGNDSLVDSPTRYGTDTGAGGEVRGNYATLNPLSAVGSGLSNGNLDVSGTSNAFHGTMAVNSGKWYFEFRKNADGDNQLGISTGYGDAGTTSFRRAWRDNNGSPTWLTDGGNAGSGVAESLTTGDILGVALDLDNNAVYFAKNNTWMNSGVPTSGASKTGAIWTDLAGSLWQVYAGANANGCYTSLNTGQRPFAYTAPSGFKALVTTNLPAPTIEDGGEYFNTVLWTGDGNNPRTVTGVGFDPDFVWIKSRSLATSHLLNDVIRGGNASLFSESTAAETANNGGGYLSAFATDGFTVTAGGSGDNAVNNTSDTYVAWNWNAGGSTVINTDGTISSNVRANPTAGFSIVTYTGNATAGATVGHGLGVAPAMIIVKARNSDVRPWTVYHSYNTSEPETEYLRLNTTNGTADFDMWNDTAPTSTVFSLSDYDWTNDNASPFIAYCFAPVAGYSAFGSYTGNGSADGPFQYLGFRPAFVMWKGSSFTSNWRIADSGRNPFNEALANLEANLTDAEGATSNTVDFLSNGFKIRGTGNDLNTSSETIIYMAFASSPFKLALAR
jgi:hypothetical protein